MEKQIQEQVNQLKNEIKKLENLNSFKEVFRMLIDLAKERVKDSGVNPSSKEGKAMVSAIYKKVLEKMGLDFSQYTTEEFSLLLEKNKAEITDIVNDTLKEELKKIRDEIKEVSDAQKKINWENLIGKPKNIFDLGHKDKDHPKVLSDIQLLFKNIISTRESLKNEFDKKIGGIRLKHSDLMKVGPDDHHPEKHTLESHMESDLMKKLLELINIPPAPRYLRHGGGASDFLALLDTPDAYTGDGDRIVKVNSGATGLEFGYKLTVSATEPSGPETNDLWIDIS